MGGPFFNSVLLTQGDIYKEYSTQRGRPLGTRGYTRDGRVFRWAKNAGTYALEVGRLVQSAAVPGTFSDDLTINAGLGVTSGATKVSLTFTTALAADTTANEYKEGFLFVNDGPGEGQMVQIASNESHTSATTLTCIADFQFATGEEFTTAVTTASEIGIVKNLYDDVIPPTNGLTGSIAGIAPRHITASYYFWLQTWGPCPCLVYSTGTNIPAAGYPVAAYLSTDGDVVRLFGEATTKLSSGATPFASGFRSAIMVLWRQPIGTVMEVGANGEFGVVDLKLAP